MQDFHAAGGMQAVLQELKGLLALDCLTVSGETLRQRLSAPAPYVDRGVIRSKDAPFQHSGGLAALFGNLAPRGAIIKRSAADPRLFECEGRAVVFESLEDLADRIDAPDLDVTPEDFLVLQNAGPASPVGMPEAGYLPIPKKLARAGVKDMVRISDARMSGTAYGTVVLHVTPDAASGGPLALVRSGDRIALSVRDRKLELLVSDEELARRRAGWRPPPVPKRGYAKLYADQILQADAGCDFAFLRGEPDGAPVSRGFSGARR
jgi:dihydroxy-acid dehydratase